MNGQTSWSELVSQPDAWEQLLKRLASRRDVPSFALDGFDELLLFGSGTSYYLALAVADWVGRRNDISVRAVPSCEVVLDPHQVKRRPGRRRLVIAISRSGESSELILAIKALQGADTVIVGVSCCADSSLLRMADRPFLIGEGHEDGLIMLRSFTSMLLALQYEFGSNDDRAALRTLPSAGRALLAAQTEPLRELARRHSFDRFVYLGSGANYPIALEASLKVQEMSISTSEAYHSLEYRHGPMANANGDTLLTLFSLTNTRLGRSLARDTSSLQATVLVVGPNADEYRDTADLVVASGAGLDDGQASVLSLLPAQIVAFETALRKGKDPDAPQNLNRVVILEPTDG
ncbi:SIS domain-containing protein [Sphingomonas sp. RB1R13]|uniref:SIS domain-containing protein n=1 Tax=Sphingomonas sp. RB1R13 TaxID=3096159 RepID=UPI002FCA31C9